jgi:hypothetical protein
VSVERQQFRVLYREFLFRMADIEALSAHAQGDTNKLLGQFASLAIFASIVLSLPAMEPPSGIIARALFFVVSMEHLLVSTTMLAVGLLAVLCWDRLFPDSRDVLTLAPLPVRGRTVFLAKAAAIATALGLTVGMLHAAAGLVWPAAFTATFGGARNFPRWFAAYWVTMLGAGAFVFCCVLAVQGVAALALPRRLFLRVSGWLQMGAFCLFVCGYFLKPKPAWSPGHWFMGAFFQMNGLPQAPVSTLGRTAWLALGIAGGVAAASYTLAHARMLRQIVEAPDIPPLAAGFRRLPRFGGPLATAVTHFSIRTMMRSRQHRLIYAFYLGLGFALTILMLRTPRLAAEPVAAATMLAMGCAVMGMRVVFALPLDLRANWMFRVTPMEGGEAALAARRRALLALAVAPVWAASAAVCFRMLPPGTATAHLVVLGLVGAVLAEAALTGPVKIPFTCSYLPGKSNVHVTFWMCVLLVLTIVAKAAELEMRAVGRPLWFGGIVAALAALLMILQRSKEPMELRFEEEPADAVVQLRLG